MRFFSVQAKAPGLEQDISFLISDQAHTLNLSFSGCLKFSHMTDKVRNFFSGPPAISYETQKSLKLNLSEMALIF